LELVVLHDSSGKPDPRIISLVQQKLLPQKAVLTYAVFREVTPSKKGKSGSRTPPSIKENQLSNMATDVEDLFTVTEYLGLFNSTFAKQLNGRKITEKELPQGERVVERITRFLASENIQLRPGGGFNHYAVASYLASNPAEQFDASTLDRFQVLFETLNAVYSAPQPDDVPGGDLPRPRTAASVVGS